MPAIQTAKMTSGQFLDLGEDPPGIRLELVDGEIELSPSPLPRHSKIILRLSRMLMDHADLHGGGEVFSDIDVVFDQHNVRRPDLFWFGPERGPIPDDRAIDQAPDLAVEVVSPSSVEIDRDVKFKLYLNHGVKFYWIVDPAQRSFEVFDLRRGNGQRVIEAGHDVEVTPPPVHGLVIPLATLWK